jgi:hypothetical protein
LKGGEKGGKDGKQNYGGKKTRKNLGKNRVMENGRELVLALEYRVRGKM